MNEDNNYVRFCSTKRYSPVGEVQRMKRKVIIEMEKARRRG